MLRRIALGLAPLLPLGACSPARIASALTPRRGVQFSSGLAYGPHPRHRLDLHAPEAAPGDAPTLLFLPGGAWVSGARADYAFLARPLSRAGMRVAVADYRLWPETGFPGFVEDGASALRFLRARHPAARLVLMGHSAGAFNAACLALDPRWGARGHVAGFIGLSGPYDFRAEEVNPPAIFAGLTRVQAVPEGTPLAGAPPLLLLHGAADATVRPQQSADLAARARAAGVPVRHQVFPGLGHIGIMTALAEPARSLGLANDAVRAAIEDFVLQSSSS